MWVPVAGCGKAEPVRTADGRAIVGIQRAASGISQPSSSLDLSSLANTDALLNVKGQGLSSHKCNDSVLSELLDF